MTLPPTCTWVGGVSPGEIDPEKLEEIAKAMFEHEWTGLDGTLAATWPNGDEEYWRRSARAALMIIEKAGYRIVPAWQPIETAPRDGTDIILGFRRRRPVIAHGFESVHGWYFSEDDDLVVQEPTHWQPLTKPPSDGEPFQWAATDGSGVVFFSGSEDEANAFAEAHGITVVRAEKTREA